MEFAQTLETMTLAMRVMITVEAGLVLAGFVVLGFIGLEKLGDWIMGDDGDEW
jgi:hypothetical protein